MKLGKSFAAISACCILRPRADRQFGHLRNLRLTQPLVYYNLWERRGVIVRGRLLVTARGPGHPENLSTSRERVSRTFQSCQNLTPRRRRPSDFTVSRQSCRGPGSMVGRGNGQLRRRPDEVQGGATLFKREVRCRDAVSGTATRANRGGIPGLVRAARTKRRGRQLPIDARDCALCSRCRDKRRRSGRPDGTGARRFAGWKIAMPP